MRVLPRSRLTPELDAQLRACFGLGSHRTPYQDALYSVQQMVEIAAHALSPGINEPFTALTCVDWLGAALSRRRQPGACRRRYATTSEGNCEWSPGCGASPSWSTLPSTRSAIYGANNPEVMVHLLGTIGAIVRRRCCAATPTARVMKLYVRLIGEERGTDHQHDRSPAGRLSASKRLSGRCRVNDELAEP
jgi:uncharacterized membrane protein